jgi:hypothetical protein
MAIVPRGERGRAERISPTDEARTRMSVTAKPPSPIFPPGELPRPLGDPLFEYRRIVRWMLVPILSCTLFVKLCLPAIGETTPQDALQSTLFALVFTLTLCAGAILPRIPTNALYLRSFRKDARTGLIRATIQDALGREFRLSGIRDPRRRWGWLTRHLAYTLFLFRYASPRHMSLEAGADWKQRLWRSLREARCAILDVTDLTPFVREEVALAVGSLGYQRVLFVVDDSKPREDWEHTVALAAIKIYARPGAIQLAIWSGKPGRRAFAERVKQFAKGLPEGVAHQAFLSYPAGSNDFKGEGTLARHWQNWAAFVAANLLALGIFAALAAASVIAPGLDWLWSLPGLGFLCLAYLLLAQYFVECGSNGQRFRVIRAFALGAFFAGVPALLDWVNPREGVRNVVRRVQSVNNLKQIGVAIHVYESSMGCLPPAALADLEGKPLLSWRVLLLPYLNEEALFREFDLKEPWDGPKNKKLLSRMPLVYRSPYRLRAEEETHTYYRVFVGPGTPLLRQAGPIEYDPNRRRLADIANPAGTILVVEATEAVPWTKPEDLEYVPSSQGGDLRTLVNQLGTTRFQINQVGFAALLCDGSSRNLPRRSKIQLDELESLIVGGPPGAIPPRPPGK